jgi:hypothetical protein
MATCSQSELLAQACTNGFICAAENSPVFKALVLQLLCNISANGGGGGSQTPWTSDIDAGGFNLSNLGLVNGVKVYRALLTQTGTDAPVATVLENSLGGVVVWTYDSPGSYFGTLVGAFPASKVFMLLSSSVASSFLEFNRNDDDSVYIQTRDNASALSDGFIVGSSIEILVFP